MTHPEELLAGYVDGTLSPRERAGVEEHLASCARCSSEVEMATMATRALAALAAPPAPEGLGDAAIKASRGSPARHAAAPRWHRAASLAAAAAVIGLVVISLPRLGEQQASRQPKAAEAAGNAGVDASQEPERSASVEMSRVATIVLQEDKDYDAKALQDLALATSAGTATEPVGVPGSEQQTANAIACLTHAGAPTQAQLVWLTAATFEETPAAIGVYLEGPGAGQPPDKVLVWAVDLKTCQVLSFTQNPLG